MNIYKVQHKNFLFLIILLISCGEDKPEEDKPQPYTATGEASYYARMFEGRKTASGVLYRKDSLTAAHRTLPFGTIVKITNLDNEKEVIVEVNDRGPYARQRIIDLSRSAAEKIDILEKGTAKVKLEVLHPAPGYTVSDSVSREPGARDPE
jgi:rare lipoprotein A